MISHPYYPVDLEIPHYIPNDRSTMELLVIAGSIMTSLVALCFIGSCTLSRKTSSVTRLTWFFISGVLHVGFESYWLYHREAVAGRNDLLAQLWKEYAHGDSRYMVADELLLTLEMMTIFIWGPLCLITCWYILKDSPKQYLFQLIASLCHIFSCSLYFIMDLPEATHCNPNPYYFYIYFVSFNMPWLIVPFILVCQSYQHITKALMLKTKTQ